MIIILNEILISFTLHIDKTLKVTITPGQSWLERKKQWRSTPHTPDTGASPSDIVSCHTLDTYLWGDNFKSGRMIYRTMYIYIYIYIYRERERERDRETETVEKLKVHELKKNLIKKTYADANKIRNNIFDIIKKSFYIWRSPLSTVPFIQDSKTDWKKKENGNNYKNLFQRLLGVCLCVRLFFFPFFIFFDFFIVNKIPVYLVFNATDINL